MATTLTSSIIEVDIPRLKRDIESVPDVRVVSINLPHGVTPTTVILTKGDKVSNLTPSQIDDVQAIIDSHIDLLDQSAQEVSRVKATIGTLEPGNVDFVNDGLAWRINEDKHFVPATPNQNIGSAINPVNIIYASHIIGAGPGGGGGGSSIWNEVLTGGVNGSNTNFTTAAEFSPGSTRVFYNGIKLRNGGSYDYTETGADTIHLNFIPQVGDELIVEYDLPAEE